MEILSRLWNLHTIFAILFFVHLYEASAALSTCGGTLRGPTGTFTSPNYPHSPKRVPEAAAVGTNPSDSDFISCEWKIYVSPGRGIQLNFGDFNMAAGLDECAKGELEVFSGTDETKKSLDKYCGSDELGSVPLSTNNATVIFRRPAEFSGKGFLVSYMETTPGEMMDDFVTCVDRGSDHVGVGSYSVLCPGGCAGITDMTIRGKVSYRDDSYVCKAAVHAGVISDVLGGRIDVKKLPGQTFYMGSEANGVTSDAGAMSDTKFEFVRPDVGCDDTIEIEGGQLTASSYWTEDEKDPEKTKWKPDKAILGKQIYAWSPNDPTSPQWLQVDLREPKVITGITTRGSADQYYTTKSYRIEYRNSTKSEWMFYRESGVDEIKTFIGNQHIFKETRNNFIKPRIVGRFIRIHPTPVVTESLRYSLQIALNGCDIQGEYVEPPLVEPTTTIKTEPTTTKGGVVAPSTRTTSPKPEAPVDISDGLGNTTKVIAITKPPSHVVTQSTGGGGGVIIKDPNNPTTDEKKPTMNENSIIVIAIVAALAVTSILLAALVLILVRKRKKGPKDGSMTPHPLQTIPDNNNTRFQYKSKKSRKRSRKNTGEHIINANYKDTLLQVTIPQSTLGLGASQSVTLPAEQAHFLGTTAQPNGTTAGYMQNGVMPQHNSFHPTEETDSFITDDEDHEYQVIDDGHVVGTTPAPSVGRGSSKASTGSSMGNHSRKSDTMQRSWGVDGSQWNNKPGSPVFNIPDPHINGHPYKPHMSSFSGVPHNGGFSHPAGHQLSRNHTFSHESRYSAGEAPAHPANLRRGNSQSPSRMQRHSSSSNNSSHSYPPNGTSPYPHDPNGPYYSSVPNGDGNPVALNHVMYGGGTIPEQIEIPASATKRAPSYKIPRPFGGDLPTLPDKVGIAPNMQNGSDPSLGFARSGSPPVRSDYDRLYRNNSTGGQTDSKNNFTVFNGSHSQYDQLNLNGAKV